MGKKAETRGLSRRRKEYGALGLVPTSLNGL